MFTNGNVFTASIIVLIIEITKFIACITRFINGIKIEFNNAMIKIMYFNNKQMIKNNNVTGSYSPCRLCHPENIRNGNLVYCFMTSGYAYHKGDCKMVDKYVISMEKYQAEERGYTPCLKCGGV
ncbi:MAG: hypothetical protein BWY74_04564 [Firmicutes bacterium ADurb.Bin419]|nr:MAG: hypothetical protein BWY74_04564 [Firmicutes bacterium ADurb.Bin419]